MKHILVALLAFSSFTVSAQTLVDFYTTESNFRIELREDLMPITAGNFIKLVKEGYYDGITFHRVIRGFMIQGGDPTGTGTGGPGYKIDDEFHPDMRHDSAGVISMANAGPNTGGSQFFITLSEQNRLDPKHPVFGSVVLGMNNVENIGKVRTSGNPNNRPLEEVVMTKVEISSGGVLSVERPVTEVLTEAYPNPFKESVHINFEVKKEGFVKVDVLDMQGRLVERLMDEKRIPEIVSLDWSNATAEAGVYHLQITTPSGIKTMRLTRVAQ